jgi:hypothetical protein
MRNPIFAFHSLLWFPLRMVWRYKIWKQRNHEYLEWFAPDSFWGRYERLINPVAEWGCKLRSYFFNNHGIHLK